MANRGRVGACLPLSGSKPVFCPPHHLSSLRWKMGGAPFLLKAAPRVRVLVWGNSPRVLKHPQHLVTSHRDAWRQKKVSTPTLNLVHQSPWGTELENLGVKSTVAPEL